MKNSFILLVLLVISLNVLCQNNSEFDKMFKLYDEQLLIDDIAVKFSKNKIIQYDLIKKYIRDSSGKELILIDDKKNHEFQTICKRNINDTVKSYIFSHKLKSNKGYNYYAYLVVFKNSKLIHFKNIYTNTNSVLYADNYGSVFIGNKYFCFYENYENENFFISNDGEIFIDDNSLNIDNMYFERISKYKINFDVSYYESDKVLLPINYFKNKKLTYLLRTISKRNFKLNTSFYIDFMNSKFYYYNILENTLNKKDKAYEVVFNQYKKDVWLKNKSVSTYFIMPNNKDIIYGNVIGNCGTD